MKAKKDWRVVAWVMVTRKCGHETQHEMMITLAQMTKLAATPCEECVPCEPQEV